MRKPKSAQGRPHQPLLTRLARIGKPAGQISMLLSNVAVIVMSVLILRSTNTQPAPAGDTSAGDTTVDRPPEPGANASIPEKGRKTTTQDTEEGVYPRLQERVQTQLGFLNNLLITLAIGVLAFSANASANSTELSELRWRKWLLFAGIILLALSVLVGLRLANNRLQSLRITARVARMRELRHRLDNPKHEFEVGRLFDYSEFFKGWPPFFQRWPSFLESVPSLDQTKKSKSCKIQNKARKLQDAINNYNKDSQDREQRGSADSTGKETDKKQKAVKEIKRATYGLMDELRYWYNDADGWTWRWLAVQTVTFIIASLLLIVIPLSYHK